MIAAVAALWVGAAPVPVSAAQLRSDFAKVEVLAAVELRDVEQPEVAKRLLHRLVEIDQAARALGGSDAELYRAIDAHNQALIKAMLKQVPWFDIDRYGERADHEAWVLVQHCDGDLAFQKDVLARLEPRVKAGQTGRTNYAYLWDRVATNEGRKQRYGTQGKCTAKATWAPNPIDEPERVDERRAWAEIWTPKLADYVAFMSARCP